MKQVSENSSGARGPLGVLRLGFRYFFGAIGTVITLVLALPATLIMSLVSWPSAQTFPVTFRQAIRLFPRAARQDFDDPLHYLKLSRTEKLLYRTISRFCNITDAIGHLFAGIGKGIVKACKAVAHELADIVLTFKNGSMHTRLSYILMGWGSFKNGQILRGVMFALFEVVFILYMIFFGGKQLSLLPSLGKQGPIDQITKVEVLPGMFVNQTTKIPQDNSFRILLYGVLTIFFIIAFIYTWRVNIRQNKISEQILASGKKLKSGKDDLRSLVDDNFHRTLLALPMTGIIVFTVMPIVFMVLVAFTNYDGAHNGYTNNLFHWVGLDNFNTLLSWQSGSGGSVQSYAATFGEVLLWTLIWAFFATFTNYFLGMFTAMAINKKGIRFKKGWRTILVLTIAIPQYISLLYVSHMFAKNGIVNGFLMDLGIISKALPFWEDPTWARIMVIVINIWIGIPYVVLIVTGILMNIPQDLYESARIDGASGWQQYSKITLPYMLFVTGPYLLTSFTGNMNNFNVIYLLTGGAPTNAAASGAAGTVGHTDLLITWLFKITTGAESQYYMASVIGIMVFVVVAVITLIVYSRLPSIKNEEDFQ
ncbi:MAG: sugar ABC transporter permease [Clostridia bacterium]|nr:sugar ABC transporter permease [Clostridia bacterium]